VWVTVRSCSRCGRELGRGGAPPTVAVCPGCGARLTGFTTSQVRSPATSPARPGGVRAGLFVLGAALAGVLVLAGGAALLVYLLRPRRARGGRGDDFGAPPGWREKARGRFDLRPARGDCDRRGPADVPVEFAEGVSPPRKGGPEDPRPPLA
jgi:hypothetical protein